MAVLTNGFDGGTDGDAVTTAASAATGDQLTYSTGSGTRTFEADPALGATAPRSVNITADNTQNMILGYAASGSVAVLSMYIRFAAAPTVGPALIAQIRNGSDSRIAQMNLTTGGALAVLNATDTTIHTFSTALSVDTWYRTELLVDPDTTSTGRIAAAFYVGDSLTPVDTAFDSSTENAGAVATLGSVRFGKLSTSGSATLYFDQVQSLDGTSTLGNPWDSGPTPSAVAATASVGGDYAERNASVVMGGASKQGVWI